MGRNVCSDVVDNTKNMKVPKGGSRNIQIVLGIVNLFFPGIGTIIAAIGDDCDGADIIIGLLQIFIFFVGWIWGIVWGVLMIINRN